MAGEPTFDLEAPIWWDPKVRSSIWDPKTFRLGLLLVRADELLVVTTRGVVVTAGLDAVGASWPEMFELPMCDLTVGPDVYRLYFVAPHPRSPHFHARIPRAVAAVLDTQDGTRVRLDTARTPAARWPSQVTEPMGRKRMVEFRAVVERPARIPDRNDMDVTQRDERATPRDERAGPRPGDAAGG